MIYNYCFDLNMRGESSSQRQQLSIYLPKIRLEERMNVMHQIALQLKKYHENCIVHRDIHSSNIMVQMKGDQHILKLKDTGFEERVRSFEGKGVMTGEQYKIRRPAPQMVDLQQFELKSDIYALGLVFHEIYERKPFVYPPNELGDIGCPQLKFLIFRMIERTPGNRPNIEQVCSKFRQFSFFKLALTNLSITFSPPQPTGKYNNQNHEILCLDANNQIIQVYAYLRYDRQILFLGLKGQHMVCYSQQNLPKKVSEKWQSIENLFYYFKHLSPHSKIRLSPNKKQLQFQKEQRDYNFLVQVINQKKEKIGYGIFISHYHILILAIYLKENYRLTFEQKQIKIEKRCGWKKNIPSSEQKSTFALVETALEQKCTPLPIKFEYFKSKFPVVYPLESLIMHTNPVELKKLSDGDTLQIKSQDSHTFCLGDFLLNRLKNGDIYGVAYIYSTGYNAKARHIKQEMLRALLLKAEEQKFKNLECIKLLI